MVKKICRLLFLLNFFFTPAAAGQKVLALQSVAIAPYEEAVRGFERVYGSEVKRLFVSEQKEKDVLREIQAIKPDMVLAVGRDALLIARRLRDIPVVYCMVLNPLALLAAETNISGVSMNLAPGKQLPELLKILPDTHDIALLYDPARTGAFVQELREAAALAGVRLNAMEVHQPQEVPRRLNNIRDRADLFWMLPDVTVIAPETVEAILLFSLENKIPILTFSEKYLERGAMLSIGIDPFDIGRQAGELAQMIFSGGEHLQHGEARKALVAVNEKIARKLGIRIEGKLLRNGGADR